MFEWTQKGFWGWRSTTATACGMLSALTSLQMVDKVNEKLPKEDQFAALGWYWLKTRRLHRDYNRLYPSGHLSRNVRVLARLMLACLLITAWGFGFFGK